MASFENILPDADFVIEGYVDPRPDGSGLRNEGPFGDHTGYYTLPSPRGKSRESRREGVGGGIPRGEPYPVFHVTAITHRKDAVYPANIVPDGSGPMEDFFIGPDSSG